MIDGLRPYPSYREAEAGWLGVVPDHWHVRRCRYLFREVDRRSADGSETHLSMSQKLGLVPSDQVERTLTSASYAGGKLCEQGDLVLNRLKAHLGVFARATQPGVISPDYTVLRPKPDLEIRYFEETLRSPACRGELRIRAKGIVEGFWRLYTDDFYAIRLPVPPPAEQAAIVRFLDHADRRIRRYIRAKQKLIKLLEEQKQAIIHQAVTRGLDPSVPMKESGVEWIGMIPAHWTIQRCRYLFREVDRRSVDGREQHLSMSQRLGLVPNDLVENRTLVSASYAGGKLCEVGDLVLNRLKAHLGVFALARTDGVISPDYTVLRPREAEGVEYFERILRSPACRRELRVRAKGIVEGFWRLYTNDFYDIRLPVPPRRERAAIVEHFLAETARLDSLKDAAEREITLLRELRTRLIADVVTGQLDVRAAAAALPDEPTDDEPLDDADEAGDDDLDADAAPEDEAA